jgi:DNA replication protein DnaC
MRRALKMGTSENVFAICESLRALGYGVADSKIQEALAHSSDDPLAIVSLALKTAVTAERNAKYEKCLRISKLGNPVFLRDLFTYKVRQLDLEYIHRLGDLSFIRDRKNLIIWGAPGTGKTWMGKAIATKACQEGIRTRWITYPFLCRELMRLKGEDSQRLESKIRYYCGFDLLCIDEFPNYDIEDKFLMQEFFNQAKIAGHSTIVCGQCSPENWDSLFEVKSFAQSIRGRLLEHAYCLELKGPDLRTYNPDKS